MSVDPWIVEEHWYFDGICPPALRSSPLIPKTRRRRRADTERHLPLHAGQLELFFSLIPRRIAITPT
jgi:hypothetical protein